MKNETKQLYFIEETQNIEGSYVEIQTLFVADDEKTAEEKYQALVKDDTVKGSTGLLLNEYVIQADETFFQKLLRSWKQLPAEFYRKMNILNYRSLAEYKN